MPTLMVPSPHREDPAVAGEGGCRCGPGRRGPTRSTARSCSGTRSSPGWPCPAGTPGCAVAPSARPKRLMRAVGDDDVAGLDLAGRRRSALSFTTAPRHQAVLAAAGAAASVPWSSFGPGLDGVRPRPSVEVPPAHHVAVLGNTGCSGHCSSSVDAVGAGPQAVVAVVVGGDQLPRAPSRRSWCTARGVSPSPQVFSRGTSSARRRRRRGRPWPASTPPPSTPGPPPDDEDVVALGRRQGQRVRRERGSPQPARAGWRRPSAASVPGRTPPRWPRPAPASQPRPARGLVPLGRARPSRISSSFSDVRRSRASAPLKTPTAGCPPGRAGRRRCRRAGQPAAPRWTHCDGVLASSGTPG